MILGAMTVAGLSTWLNKNGTEFYDAGNETVINHVGNSSINHELFAYAKIVFKNIKDEKISIMRHLGNILITIHVYCLTNVNMLNISIQMIQTYLIGMFISSSNPLVRGLGYFFNSSARKFNFVL